MSKISYKQARQMLFQACNEYRVHNANQLHKIEGTRVLSRGVFPKAEKGPWLSCAFERLLHSIYGMEFFETHECSPKRIKLIHSSYKYFEEERHYEDYQYGQLKEGDSGFQLYSNPAPDLWERRGDVLFLHNMLVLNRLLYQVFARNPIEVIPNSEYSLCVKKDDSIIEKKKLYLSLRKNSDRIETYYDQSYPDGCIEIGDYSLEYTFKNYAGEINTASVSLDSVCRDLIKRAELLSKPFNEDSLPLVSLGLILEITAKRGHTHTDEKLLQRLKQYREQHQQIYECSEQTPLGWYMFPMVKDTHHEYVDPSRIGNDKDWTTFEQFRVMPPINPVERSMKWEEYRHSVHLPYIESKEGSIYPLSIQIHQTLNNFKSLVDFMSTLPKYSSEECKQDFMWLRTTVDKTTPIFEGYTKGLAVKELTSILSDSNLSDEEAVKAFEAQLKNHPDTMKILTRNRQSQCEYLLKLLSLFSILIGVGIFTTLGLACKRLYDTRGTSINFFKPLAQNLTEDIDTITASIEPN